MKKVLFVFLTLLTLLTACSKTQPNTSSASWTIGAQNYTSTTVQSVNYKQIIASSGQDSMQVFFSVLPSANGTYTVVSESKAAANTLGATEMAVRYTVGSNDVYLSTGAPIGTTVSVVLTDASIAFVVPAISVEHRVGGNIADTTTAGGVIKQ